MFSIAKDTRFKIKGSSDPRLQPGDDGVAQAAPGGAGWFMASFLGKGKVLVHISQVAQTY